MNLQSTKTRLIALLFIAACVLVSTAADRRVRDGLKPIADKERKAKEEKRFVDKMKGCLELSGDSAGMSMDSVFFTGFNKSSSSDKESFFVTNRTHLALAGFSVEITYLSIDGRMLHRRTVEHEVYVPAGQTRKVDIMSFDRQRSFHYVRSSPGRSGATPFKVTLSVQKLWFRR